MSNQRVVVLTDEELRHGEAFVRAAASVEAEPSTREALEHTPVGSFIRKLTVALEHPGGITDEMKQRGGKPLVGYTCHSEEAAEALASEVLEAALFPGDGER